MEKHQRLSFILLLHGGLSTFLLGEVLNSIRPTLAQSKLIA